MRECRSMVRRPIRAILAEAHIAAVAIAVLLLWSIRSVFVAFREPIYHAATFLVTAAAIHDVPYISRTLTSEDRSMLIMTSFNLFDALVNFAAAWLLSRWIYGVGPLRCLSKYRTVLARRSHVE